MKAKITNPMGFRCAPKGSTVETFAKGMIVEGQVAEWAVRMKQATKISDPRTETKIVAPAETKATKTKGKK